MKSKRIDGRRVLRLLTAAVLVVFAASCGSAKPAPAEKVLDVLMTQDWADTAPFLAAVREFEGKHPGVHLNIEKVQIRLMAETVRSRLADGNPPDVVQWHAFAAGAQGLAEPVDDLWTKYKIDPDEFFPGAVADVVWGSHRYGVPLDTNALVIFYSKRIDAQGLAEPVQFNTFSDLEQAAKAVTQPDGSRHAFALPNSYWSAYGWIRANGGEVVEIEPDGSPRFTLDSPAVVQAVSFLSDLVKRGYALPPAGANGDNDSLALFRTGATAFFTSGSWDLATLANESSTFGVTLMPKGVDGNAGGTVMGGSSLFISKGSRNADLAFQFIDLLTSDHYALRLAKEEGRLPVRSRVFEDPYFQEPRLQVFLAQLESAHPFLLEAFPEATKAFESALLSVLNDGEDAAKALSAAQVLAEQSMAGAKMQPS